MRKFALAALLAAASLSPLAAQTARMFSYDGIAVEADAGAAADVSWMSFVAAEDLTTTPAALLGCSVGAGASLRILQGLYLRGELDLSLRRSGNADLGVDYNPLYFHLPVTVEVRVPVFENLSLLAFGGVWGAAGIGGSSVNGNVRTPFFGSGADSFADRLDYGWTAGAGCIVKEKFRIRASFGYGLKDIANSHTQEVGHFFNNYLSFGLGYIF